MPFTQEEIERDWLTAGKLGVDTVVGAGEAVAAFDVVERKLGRDWIERARTAPQGNLVYGLAPTLHIITIGQKLTSLEGAPGAEELIRDILRDQEAAHSELSAVHILRSAGGTQIELYPEVGNRKADAKVRSRDGEPWSFVEVCRPDISNAYQEAHDALEQIAAHVSCVEKPFGVEVFLRRTPTGEELSQLCADLPNICCREDVHRQALANELGVVVLNACVAGAGNLSVPEGERTNVPRIGLMKVMVGPEDMRRQVSVRLEYGDDRAEAFLTREARQLPTDSPGLIMVVVGANAPGIKSMWEPIVKRRFQPNIHTRVGAVCLFGGGFVATDHGEEWLPWTRLLINSHARLPLPKWLVEGIIRVGLHYTRIGMQPSAPTSRTIVQTAIQI